MKNVIAVVLLVAIIAPANNYAAPSRDVPPLSHKHISYTNPESKEAEVNHADIHLNKKKDDEKPKPKPGLEPPKNEPLSFRSINGVSVDWKKEDLLANKGMPDDMRRDGTLGTVELTYGDVIVGWYDGGVDYLIVPASRGTIVISGTKLPMAYMPLRLALGKPDYEAEDGIVYERDGLCLKLFLSPGAGAPKLTSVQVYWSASV